MECSKDMQHQLVSVERQPISELFGKSVNYLMDNLFILIITIKIIHINDRHHYDSLCLQQNIRVNLFVRNAVYSLGHVDNVCSHLESLLYASTPCISTVSTHFCIHLHPASLD